ncbi:response regulator transcription factor [Panacibacter sp. DH6]|uniref:Response regulator transcription factor n=1 Tax=Panacibacter microcysteis TaxID=2793269 RepID=A0A931E4Q1_9BACT|nr:response regulator transcription factor [Panacibacter microcysteis]MBG9377013.1 response regulator transcription factor [Panacibacter microcysteis]
MLRILIADDHTVVRRGLKQILLEEFSSAFIDEAADAETLLSKIAKEEWDVVISDLSMPGRSGIEALQQIKLTHPRLPVLILSVHAEEHYAVRVLKAGASGYVNKESAPEELIKAVHRLLLGKKYITATIAEQLASTLDKDNEKPLHEYLSDREFEVLKLLAAGKSVSDIATQMSLSVTTVSTYRARIMAKMNLKTNADLTLYAVQHNLI